MDTSKLIKLLNLTTSDNDAEALSAIRMANALVKKAGGLWDKVVGGGPQWNGFEMRMMQAMLQSEQETIKRLERENTELRKKLQGDKKQPEWRTGKRSFMDDLNNFIYVDKTEGPGDDPADALKYANNATEKMLKACMRHYRSKSGINADTIILQSIETDYYLRHSLTSEQMKILKRMYEAIPK